MTKFDRVTKEIQNLTNRFEEMFKLYFICNREEQIETTRLLINERLDCKRLGTFKENAFYI